MNDGPITSIRIGEELTDKILFQRYVLQTIKDLIEDKTIIHRDGMDLIECGIHKLIKQCLNNSKRPTHEPQH